MEHQPEKDHEDKFKYKLMQLSYELSAKDFGYIKVSSNFMITSKCRMGHKKSFSSHNFTLFPTLWKKIVSKIELSIW